MLKALKSPRFYAILITKGGVNMKKHHGTTKKKYDWRITPQNEPYIHFKRLIHFLSCFWLVINCIVLAILLPETLSFLLPIAFVFIFYAVIQQIDNRRGNWVWFGIVFIAIISVVLPAFVIFSYKLYWYLIVIAAQILISTIIFIIFKKK